MRLWLALRLFFRTLFDRPFADEARQLIRGHLAHRSSPSAGADAAPVTGSATTGSAKPRPATTGPATIGPAKPGQPPAAPAPPKRSEAVALLAMLQREARFVDIVNEPLAEYSDAQIGAAARDVLRDCQNALERVFALRPVVEGREGDATEVPADYDPTRYRLIGESPSQFPLPCRIVHPGWEATRCELPQWTGTKSSAMVVAPVEVQVDGKVGL